MSYAESIEFLYSLRLFGARLGLETTRRLAAMVGHPETRLRFIHVAGTNGKGSTCAMLESVYRTAGFKVGLFTSPHLISFCERIQINRVPISETDAARLLTNLKPMMASFSREAHPTFFEIVTIMALQYFAEQGCDLVIWETGLGGRLDATNIVTPLVSVITNVQLDHQLWLGNTIEEIAREKAGIIKSGVPVITGAQRGGGVEIIEQTAAAKGCVLFHAEAEGDERFPINLQGDFQRANARVALKTIEALQRTLPISVAAIETGLRSVVWPGRFQKLSRRGGEVILDGAHNPDGARALCAELQKLPQAPVMILGMLSDKNWSEMAQEFARHAKAIYAVPVSSSRSLPPPELASFCQAAQPNIRVLQSATVGEALAATEGEPLVLVTGSLYLVGEALKVLRKDVLRDERALNEWQMSPLRG